MAAVPTLEQFPRIGTSRLSYDDAIRPQPKRRPNELSDRDGRKWPQHLRDVDGRRNARRQFDVGQVLGIPVEAVDLVHNLRAPAPDPDAAVNPGGGSGVREDLGEGGPPGSGAEDCHGHRGAGPDLLRARDGEPDRVDCGPGRDRARVDDRDRVRRCEAVLQPPS